MKASEYLESESGKSSTSNNAKRIKKTVSFAEGTIELKHDTIALSISKHQYVKELGYTQYHIQLMYREVEWSLYKRYRDFEELHNNLVAENFENGLELPKLPKKRWFEKQRWLNKYEESYSSNRRCALQNYLRQLVRIPALRRSSLVLKSFIDFHFIENIHDNLEDEQRYSDSQYARKGGALRQEFYSVETRFDEEEDRGEGAIDKLRGEFAAQRLSDLPPNSEEGCTNNDNNDNNNSSGSSDSSNRIIHSSSPNRNGSTTIILGNGDASGGSGSSSSSCSSGINNGGVDGIISNDDIGSEDSEFDYNARVVTSAQDYNSNDSDSDDEHDDADSELMPNNNNNTTSINTSDNNSSSSNGSAVNSSGGYDADRHSFSDLLPLPAIPPPLPLPASYIVTDSGEIVYLASPPVI